MVLLRLELQDQLSTASLSCSHFLTVFDRWPSTDQWGRQPHAAVLFSTQLFFLYFCFLTSLACQYFKQEPLHVSTSISNPDPLEKWEDLATLARLSHSCSCWRREAAAGSTHSLQPLPTLCPPGLALPVQFLTKPTDIWISILVCSSLLFYKESTLNYETGSTPRTLKRLKRLNSLRAGHLEIRTVTRRSSGAESLKA